MDLLGLPTQLGQEPPPGGLPPAVSIKVTVPTEHIPTKLDDRGRLKLPIVLKRPLVDKLELKKLYVTSLDGRSIVVFSLDGWQSQLAALQSFSEDRKSAQVVLFAAKCYGSEVDLDDAGRFMMPDALRKEMGLADQTVWLDPVSPGRINIYPDLVYQDMKAEMKKALPAAFTLLSEKGIV
jgi:DNA-binding transcriptional regulator/RsmH inhibitor MraZ